MTLVKYYNSFVDNVTSYCTHQIIYQRIWLCRLNKSFFFLFFISTNQYKLIKTGIKTSQVISTCMKRKQSSHKKKNKKTKTEYNKTNKLHVDCYTAVKWWENKTGQIQQQLLNLKKKSIVQWNKSSYNSCNRNSPLCQFRLLKKLKRKRI